MESKLKKCLFPVGGYGTRFLPATKVMPKEMLPVVNKPLVQYGVEEAIAAGMTEIGFVTGRGKRAIADHFDVSYELEHQISGTSKERYLDCIRHVMSEGVFAFTRQSEMKGLGHAVLTGEPLVGQEAFGVVLADDLCLTEPGVDSVMGQLARVYARYQCSVVAVMEVPRDEIHKYGVVDASELQDGVYQVKGLVEKPSAEDAPSNLAVIGRYVLTPDIFDILRDTPPGKGDEIQLTDALEQQALNGAVVAWKIQGKRFDCGSVEGYVEATNYCFDRLKTTNL